MRSLELSGFVMTAVGTACWVVCFVWMHRISKRQNVTLAELHRVTKRIERLAKEEHELIHELHPTVGQIRETVGDVAEAVAAKPSDGKPGSGTTSTTSKEHRV